MAPISFHGSLPKKHLLISISVPCRQLLVGHHLKIHPIKTTWEQSFETSPISDNKINIPGFWTRNLNITFHYSMLSMCFFFFFSFLQSLVSSIQMFSRFILAGPFLLPPGIPWPFQLRYLLWLSTYFLTRFIPPKITSLLWFWLILLLAWFLPQLSNVSLPYVLPLSGPFFHTAIGVIFLKRKVYSGGK